MHANESLKQRLTVSGVLVESPGMTAIILTVILVGTFLRFFRLGFESLNYDELASIWTSKLQLSQIIPQAIAAGHPPVFNLITHFWPMPAAKEFFARAPSAFFGILIIPLAYLTGKELRDPVTGLWAAAFLGVSPLMIWYSRDATYYSWLTFISLLSFYFLIRSSRRGRLINWSMYVFSALLVIFSYFLAFILIIAGALVFWIIRGAIADRLRHWVLSNAFLGFVLVIFFFASRSATVERAGLSLPSMLPLLKNAINWPVVFMQGYANQNIGGGVLGPVVSQREGLITVTVVAAIAVLLAVSRSVRMKFFSRETLATLVYLVILVLLPIAVQLAAPGAAFATRYYVWAAPAFAIFLGLILAKVPGRLAIPAGLILLAIMLFYTGNEIRVRRNEDWRGIMSIINTDSEPGDKIMCFPEEHCLVAADFYRSADLPIFGGYIGGKTYIYFRPWHGFNGEEPTPLSGSSLADKIKNDLAGAGTIWLITGDGSLGNYPASGQANAIMEKYWQKDGYWNFPPLELVKFSDRRIKR